MNRPILLPANQRGPLQRICIRCETVIPAWMPRASEYCSIDCAKAAKLEQLGIVEAVRPWTPYANGRPGGRRGPYKAKAIKEAMKGAEWIRREAVKRRRAKLIMRKLNLRPDQEELALWLAEDC